LALDISVRILLERRAQERFAFFAKAKLDPLASLAEPVAATWSRSRIAMALACLLSFPQPGCEL
jgi:hypothetical protein